MMTLYSGTTCPFSQRCRFVLYEKGMDFEIKDVDIFQLLVLVLPRGILIIAMMVITVDMQ